MEAGELLRLRVAGHGEGGGGCGAARCSEVEGRKKAWKGRRMGGLRERWMVLVRR